MPSPIVVMSALSFNLLNGYTVALIDTFLKTNDIENFYYRDKMTERKKLLEKCILAHDVSSVHC